VNALDDPRIKLLEVFPFLINLPYFKKIAATLDVQLIAINGYFQRKVAEHREKLALEIDKGEIVEEAAPRDYVEAFLRELDKKERNHERDHYFRWGFDTNLKLRSNDHNIYIK
jgi:hypothetical protein